MKKNIITAFFLLAALIGAVCFFKVSTVEDYYDVQSPLWESGPGAELVIDCRAVLDNRNKLDEKLNDEKYIPKDGMILPATKLRLEDGDTAYSLLLRAAKYYRIPLDVQGFDESDYGSVYVRGINNLYEFSCGDMSGWMYSVNGDFPGVGCDQYLLKDGDVVRFIYTCSLGEDIGGDEFK